MFSVGIIGASGYTGSELLRLLVNHPNVKVDFAYSKTFFGQAISSVHQDLIGEDLPDFTNNVNPEVDVVFLCLGHGKSKEFLSSKAFSNKTKIIDLGNDFRLTDDSDFNGKTFVYGLPELNRMKIKEANFIANPGCFATAIQLSLLPLAKNGWLKSDVHVNATTGSTGAGVSLSETSHHPYRNGNMSHYKAFSHQHLGEINQSLRQIDSEKSGEILFIPNRGDFTRGIFATLYTKLDVAFADILSAYENFYKDEPFVNVTTENISLKPVLQTNNCLISVEQKGDYVLLTSVIDNLVKGASGQAIQNMNLMLNLEETAGLRLKSAAF
ncbi:N-acetyl-gamma-glutamyl-phosphate reductase [Flavobacterium sp. MAH-1]|uniref:N-acetyl-gamma-glutamyl-phosphate reductase n=1 Tax=Flavobacterium agri TaxID=2743471 RepID=A0A7Y9C6Q2_9FLAO|nr:N-acetyl-gamma-glutamyl-phosphate reductase [Flavobacterium agri]NUY82532.1 N-acetyl-gamma-glutamyl-phosphate reductase [Flavobacterium agri]NYA72556.1 N-acetyl-gamma-glutamyl-phosphate reductase [Flavobacterium agri]